MNKLLPLWVLCFALLFKAAAAHASDPMRDYRPAQSVSGEIRIAAGKVYGQKLLEQWQAGFQKHHPQTKFTYLYGKGSGAPLVSLIAGQADLTLMGRELNPHETLTFYRAYTSDPLILTTATGTFASLDKTMAMVVIVHKDNPLTQASFEQLDGIFGEQRSGGFEGQYWRTERGRGPEKNLRTWGQLGLGGEWRDRPIQTYGYDLLRNAFAFFMAQKILNGGDKWNANLREFGFSIADGEMKMHGRSHEHGSSVMVEAVAGDRYGIGYVATRDVNDSVKVLALSRTPGGPYIAPSQKTVADRTYPLTRSIYWVVRPPYGADANPVVREYLDYVLSRQGQEAVQREGDYLPLTPQVAAAERRKVERAAAGKVEPFRMD